MIFSAMQQSETHRTEVYKALAELPMIICDHTAFGKGHDNDEQLHRRASELYASIFRLLAHIFNWYSKNFIVTGIKLIVNPSRLGERLKESFAEVKLRAQEFGRRAMKLSQELQDKSMQLQYWSHFNQVKMRRDLEHIRASTSTIDQKLTRAELLELFDPILQTITDKVESRLQSYQKRHRLRKRLARVDLAKFLEDFQYEQDLVFQDCESFTSRLGVISLGKEAEAYLTVMQHNYQMRGFLTADEPSLLAVIGQCDPEPDSGLSLLTAKIVQRLFVVTQTRDPGEKIAKVIPLVFFCGRHRNRQRDPYTNPTEVALSLLMQLIDRHRDYIDLEFLDRCRSSMDPTDIESICSALKKLITSLSDNVILVIIIEGLEFFAQSGDMREPARHLFQTLVSTYRSGLSSMMKCLLMSSSRLDFVENVLDDDEILEISMDSHHNGHYPEWLRHEPLQIEFY
ncbi:hypothetical protein Daus18300_010049 [Diaporthe australafricana]|uniref:Uncharacterized protein n=1 Tax=Diaporthe australafricana TaxID=127596 RepID=A0ABR3WBR0_9PEZI